MPKFQRKSDYRRPDETAVPEIEEAIAPSPMEAPVIMPKEAPTQRICGINGCTTWYDDPVVMERHRRRQHGIGGENLNKPLPRNPNIKLA